MDKFCLNKIYRLQKSSDFKTLSVYGKTIKKQLFIVSYGQQQKTSNVRLGIIVSKRCSKRAVDRNRIKRIIRESFRLNKEQLDCYDIVIISRKLAVTASNEELFKELESVWQKLILFCK